MHSNVVGRFVRRNPWRIMALLAMWTPGCTPQPIGRIDFVNQTTGPLQLCIGSTPWPQCVPSRELPPGTIKVKPFTIGGEVWLLGLWVDYDSEFKSVLKDGIVLVDGRAKQKHLSLAELLQRRECLDTDGTCRYWRIRLDSRDLPP